MSRYNEDLNEMLDDALQDRDLPESEQSKKTAMYSLSKLIGIDCEALMMEKELYFSTPSYERSGNNLCEMDFYRCTGEVPSCCALEHLSLRRVISKLKLSFGEENLKIIYTGYSLSERATGKFPGDFVIRAKYGDSDKDVLFFWFYKPMIIKLDDCVELKDDVIIDNIICKYCLSIIHSSTYDIASLANNLRDASIKDIVLDKPSIEVIQNSAHGLHTQLIILDKKYDESDEDFDLHYGEDFHIFHHKLISRMISGDKGLIMFHGAPGTGKTNYIRRLLPLFTKNKKRVVIIPKYILEEVESPTFSTFMISNFNNSKAVFIIEDAESIIQKRDEPGNRSQVISTLLNISDGILNDLYKIQVILTFNTELKNIDEALLRKGRLIAKHEFKALSPESAEKLCKKLNLEVPSGDLTLANIYAQKDSIDDEILISGITKKKEVLGF